MHIVDYAVARCLSVWYSVNIAEHILRMFWQYSNGHCLMGHQMQGGMKKTQFLTNISLICEMMQVRAIVTMEDEHETINKLLNGAISNDLE